MQLEQIEAVVRPRNPWEAIDLGFSLVRHWYSPLAILWFSMVIPLILLIYGVLYTQFTLAVILVWWLKPLYDRLILYFLSRALFGERPPVRQLFKALPQLLTRTRLISALTWQRLQLDRSFKLPVWQLEGLNTSAGQQRLIQLRCGQQAELLTLMCLTFETLIYISLLGLLYLMLPSYYELPWQEWLSQQQRTAIQLFWIGAHLIALTIIEPLYVASGFSLYLNRRTHLEGWDIELIFRQLAKRLSRQ